MVAIKITGFSGEQPRVLPRLIPDTAAQAASNTRLDDGALTPIRKSAIVGAAPANSKTIVKFGADWLAWPTDVNAAPGPVADDRLYFTGDGVPKMKVGATIYPLAVPRPTGALTATLGGTGAGDAVTRLYAYTWVTDLGEESEPNQVSNEIVWKPGNTVTLSGFAAPPAGRAISKQRIYRSQTSKSGTALYFIAERAASNANFSDTVPVNAFQEPLPSVNWNAPPDDLQGLIALPNGMMAAFRGKQLYFCEPWRPHAWPEKYILTTDSAIKGIGAVGTTVVIMTAAQPYIAVGSTPDTMQMDKIEQNLPCINAKGIVDLGYAIAYPSNEGLVVVRADGSCTMATVNIFNRDDWSALSPETMIGCQLSGRYVAFYSVTAIDGSKRAGALFLDLSGQSFLIRSDHQASAAYFDIETSSLYFLRTGTGEIVQFDAPNAAREKLYWKSKEFVLPYPDNMGAILVDATLGVGLQDEKNLEEAIAATKAANDALIAAGPIKGEVNGDVINAYPFAGDMLAPLPRQTATFLVGVYADKKRVASVTSVNRVVRLPAGFTARIWEIDVFSDIQIQSVTFGKTVDEVKLKA